MANAELATQPAPSHPSYGNGYEPADTLNNRTFIGLLVAQFLAAFNDQAIHASAMFFAINTGTLTEAEAISLMPILFYAPWAIFCTVAGWLADRYSKVYSLVAWKIAEVIITGVALIGFYLGTQGNSLGPWLVLSTVFLMGTHSAFFVPAKYGVMPEILKPSLLSRGNGLLESLSFLAIILGTVAGGVLSFVFLRQETNIGIILFSLAIIGALASLMIRKMPAANPNTPFPRYIYGSLLRNLRTLVSLRPLRLALIGIAFFTFVVAFMRATVYMLGESQNPRWDEQKTSIIVGTVALGIGLGSPLAGWLSGRKIELGLIPIGLLGMFFACVVAALTLDYIPGLIVCIVLIGFFTGFYLVPQYTLLQYRAPKTDKGTMIATSNFVNVTGAIAASALFFVVVFAAERLQLVPRIDTTPAYRGELVKLQLLRGRPVGFMVETPEGEEVERGLVDVEEKPATFETIWRDLIGDSEKSGSTRKTVVHSGRELLARITDPDTGEVLRPGDEVIVDRYNLREVMHYDLRPSSQPKPRPHYDREDLPAWLFLGAGGMTVLTLLALMTQLPDLLRRMWWFFRMQSRQVVHVNGLRHLPPTGHQVLLINTDDEEFLHRVNAATDRLTHFVTVPADANGQTLEQARDWLLKDEFLAFSFGAKEAEQQRSRDFLHHLRHQVPGMTVIPVYCGPCPQKRDLRMSFGMPVSPESSLVELHEAFTQTACIPDET